MEGGGGRRFLMFPATSTCPNCGACARCAWSTSAHPFSSKFFQRGDVNTLVFFFFAAATPSTSSWRCPTSPCLHSPNRCWGVRKDRTRSIRSKMQTGRTDCPAKVALTDEASQDLVSGATANGAVRRNMSGATGSCGAWSK